MLDIGPLIAQIGYPPNLEPHPSGFEAGQTAELFFTLYCGLAVVLLALPWAIHRAIKRRDTVPILVLAGGLVCSLEEPMLDMLGHLHWADDLEDLYNNFGVPVPALIPPCYVAFLGLQAYFCYFVIKNGARPRHFVQLLFMGLILDAVMETVGINLDVYEYYGVQPYEILGFPYWWGFINGASFVTVGFIVWYAAPRLKGAKKLLLLFAPPAGMMSTYFVVGWIHIFAHNSGLPEELRWIAATIMMVETVGWMYILAHFAARKENESYINWTLPRMFAFILLPSGERRRRLWKKMEEEGRVTVTEPVPELATTA